MRNITAVLAVLYAALSAEDISFSKDTLLLYTNPLSSFADRVIVTSTAPDTVFLDSVYLSVQQMDTTGWGWYIRKERLQIVWRDNTDSFRVYYWDAVTAGDGNYRLVPALDESGHKNIRLPAFAPVSSGEIFMVEIGGCLRCSGLPPQHPVLFEGNLLLHFSNGEKHILHLTAGSSTGLSNVYNVQRHTRKQECTKSFTILLNGRRIDDSVIMKTRTGFRRILPVFTH